MAFGVFLQAQPDGVSNGFWVWGRGGTKKRGQTLHFTITLGSAALQGANPEVCSCEELTLTWGDNKKAGSERGATFMIHDQ